MLSRRGVFLSNCSSGDDSAARPAGKIEGSAQYFYWFAQKLDISRRCRSERGMHPLYGLCEALFSHTVRQTTYIVVAPYDPCRLLMRVDSLSDLGLPRIAAYTL